MRHGKVVSIRVNPTDCMAIVDMAQKLGVSESGMSFSQLVSISLTSLLEAMRQNNVIPTRDGFEYGRMLAAYPNPRGEARKAAIAMTRAIGQAGSDFQVKAVIPASVEIQRKRVRYAELQARFDTDEANMEPGEVEELRALIIELHPG